MSIEEGAYSIKNVSTTNNLDLQAGWWHFGSVRQCPAHDGIPPDQQWFVARPPGASQDEVVLFNLRAGSYAGIWKRWGRGKDLVQCSPSHLSAVNLGWKATRVAADQSRCLFCWTGDEEKRLVCDGTKSSVLVRKIDAGDEVKAPMHWILSPLDDATHAWQSWMDRLPDDIMLTDINLPSTHQSLACRGVSKIRPDMGWSGFFHEQFRPWLRLPQFIDNPRCQDISLWEQLQMGIRGFDIRLDLNKSPVLQRRPDGSLYEEIRCFLYARHGLAEMGHSWSAVLLTLRVFLQSNPSEFVLMNVRYEKSTNGAQDRSQEWMRTFVDETEMFWSEENTVIYKWWERDAPTMQYLPLGHVRGKVIFTVDGSYMPADGKDNRMQNVRCLPEGMRSVGKYDSNRDQWDQQLRDCEGNLTASCAQQERRATDLDSQRYHQTSFNVSGLPHPLKYTFMLKQPLHPSQALRDAGNEVFDPKHFFDHLKANWQSRGPESPLSQKKIGVNGQHRLGKIDFDFCDQLQPEVINIIRSNKTKAGREFEGTNLPNGNPSHQHERKPLS